MPFVKIDCGILDSTIWFDRDARAIFLTALLMAEPREIRADLPQLQVDTLDLTGFVIPPGWYGFVPASGQGIIARAGLELQSGLAALERLGQPEKSSRTPAWDGRRMARVDGGYIILNYQTYRDRDYTTAERSRRYRERKKNRAPAPPAMPPAPEVSSQRDVTHHGRDITQAEVEVEVKTTTPKPPSSSRDGVTLMTGGSALSAAGPLAPPAQSSMTRGLPKSRNRNGAGKPEERPPDSPPRYVPRDRPEAEIARGENPGGWRDIVPKPAGSPSEAP